MSGLLGDQEGWTPPHDAAAVGRGGIDAIESARRHQAAAHQPPGRRAPVLPQPPWLPAPPSP